MTDQESRKELRSAMLSCGNDCGKTECLALCEKHDWFACEYHNNSHNCVAIIVPIVSENTFIPALNKEQGFCYFNRNKIPFKFT